MNDINVIFDLPTDAAEISSDLTFSHKNGNSEVQFNYYVDDLIEKTCVIEAVDVYKFIFTSDSCCNPFQIEKSYEQVVSLGNSTLLSDLKRDANLSGMIIGNDISHFMIYIPDYGCYEFIAAKISHTLFDKIE